MKNIGKEMTNPSLKPHLYSFSDFCLKYDFIKAVLNLNKNPSLDFYTYENSVNKMPIPESYAKSLRKVKNLKLEDIEILEVFENGLHSYTILHKDFKPEVNINIFE